jgi:hypothetical protein
MQFASPPHHSDRRHIDVDDPEDLRIWSKHLGVSPEAIRKVTEKVGNAVPSIRKELGISEPEPDV